MPPCRTCCIRCPWSELLLSFIAVGLFDVQYIGIQCVISIVHARKSLLILLKSGAIRRNKSNGSEWLVLDFVPGCFELLMLPTEVEKAAWQRSIGQPPCFG